jgi:hypothetical protein
VSYDIEGILRQLSFNPSDVADVFDKSEIETVAALDRMNMDDVGAVIQRIAPGLAPEAYGELNAFMTANFDILHKVYAGAVAVYAAHQSLRKNAQVGLYGTDAAPGALYAPGTIFNARPRLVGVPQVQDFEFLPDYTFYRLYAEELDADRGWHIVANSVRFSDEIVSGIRFDVPFTSITNDVPADESPLGSMFKRSPKIPVRFQVQVRLDSLDPQPFHGLTLQFADMSCRSGPKVFADNIEDLNFAGLTKLVMDSVRESIRRRPVLTGGGTAAGRPIFRPTVTTRSPTPILR